MVWPQRAGGGLGLDGGLAGVRPGRCPGFDALRYNPMKRQVKKVDGECVVSAGRHDTLIEEDL